MMGRKLGISTLVAICLLLTAVMPGRGLAASPTGSVFALAASYYPSGSYVGGRLVTNREATLLLGDNHRTNFDGLGRVAGHGWFQGGWWQRTNRHGQLVILMTSYLISQYASPAAAREAVSDLYVDGVRWHGLTVGTGGRSFRLVNNGYTVLLAAFAEGPYDVEDLSIIEPHTPSVYHGELRAARMVQLQALDKILVAQPVGGAGSI